MKVLKNYWQTILLLVGMLIGGLIGILNPEFALTLKPFGDLFINLIFMLIVPLIFFSIAGSIASVGKLERLGKIISRALIVFAVTSVIAVLLGIASNLIYKPLTEDDVTSISETLNLYEVENDLSNQTEVTTSETNTINGIEQFVKSITTSDFNELLSRNNILQLIVFSILIGIATNLVGEKGVVFGAFLKSGNEVIMKVVSIIMYYAPIGLSCYFAALIGELGAALVTGYIRSFVGYLVLSLFFYFILYSFYAWIAGGKNGVKAYWKNILPTSLTALASCSSGVAIPSNIEAAKNMGVPKDIAETVIPLGTNIHKEGSLYGSVLKIMFLFLIFGKEIVTLPAIGAILGVSILAGFLISAVPTGGGVISEALILSMFGFPASALGILATIAVVIDAPATVINVVGNTTSALLTTRLVEGKVKTD